MHDTNWLDFTFSLIIVYYFVPCSFTIPVRDKLSVTTTRAPQTCQLACTYNSENSLWNSNKKIHYECRPGVEGYMIKEIAKTTIPKRFSYELIEWIHDAQNNRWRDSVTSWIKCTWPRLICSKNLTLMHVKGNQLKVNNQLCSSSMFIYGLLWIFS